jgi:hypothetical protein
MPDPISPDRLAEIRDRAQAATPGPWRTHDTYVHDGGYCMTVLSGDGNSTEPRAWLPTFSNATGSPMARNVEADAEFMAAARQDVPELLAEVDRLTAELAKAQAATFPPNEDGQRFEPGKRYITDNECFVFHCEQVVAGIALGIEVRTDGRPGFTSQRVYHSVMPEGCWREMDAADPTCAVAERAEEVVKAFDAGPRLAVNEFVDSLKRALEMQ